MIPHSSWPHYIRENFAFELYNAIILQELCVNGPSFSGNEFLHLLHCQWYLFIQGVNPELEDYIDLPRGGNEENIVEAESNVENDEVKYTPLSFMLCRFASLFVGLFPCNVE